MNEAEMKLIGDLLQVKFNARRLNRFWASVNNTSLEHECWEWQKGLTSKGYGKVKMRPKTLTAHRVAYAIANKELPALLMHSCDNPKCVNPAHLSAGTHKENMADMVAKRRQATGTTHGVSKLTESDVLDIRQMYADGVKVRLIAEKHGIKAHSISNICAGRVWAFLPNIQPPRRPNSGQWRKRLRVSHI